MQICTLVYFFLYVLCIFISYQFGQVTLEATDGFSYDKIELIYYVLLPGLFSLPWMILVVSKNIDTKKLTIFEAAKIPAGHLGVCILLGFFIVLKMGSDISFFLSYNSAVVEKQNIIIEYGYPQTEKARGLNFLAHPFYSVYTFRGLERMKIGVCQKVYKAVLAEKLIQLNVDVVSNSDYIYFRPKCEI